MLSTSLTLSTLALVVATATGCTTESRYAQDPDAVNEYQALVTLVGSAPEAAPGESLVVDFALAGTDVDEAIATATGQWGHAPVRALLYSLDLSGRAGVCRLSLLGGSGRVYPIGIAALPGDPSPVTRTAQVLPSMPFSTDTMTPEDAQLVLAAEATIRSTCEPLATGASGPTAFALVGGFQVERR